MLLQPLVRRSTFYYRTEDVQGTTTYGASEIDYLKCFIIWNWPRPFQFILSFLCSHSFTHPSASCLQHPNALTRAPRHTHTHTHTKCGPFHFPMGIVGISHVSPIHRWRSSPAVDDDSLEKCLIEEASWRMRIIVAGNYCQRVFGPTMICGKY